MEKETLEEAAKRNHNEQKLNTFTPYSFTDAFIDGAKWQAERMYSEEEVIELFTKYKEEFSIYRNMQILDTQFIEWFEKFKKK